MPKLSLDDRAVLEEACKRLENPSLAIRMSSALGMPVEAVTREISKRAPNAVVEAVSKSTHKALDFVLASSMKSMSATEQVPARPRLHTAAAMTSGAVSGFFCGFNRSTQHIVQNVRPVFQSLTFVVVVR